MLIGSKNMRVPLPREFSVSEFDNLVRQAARPTVAAFLAPWSRPCQLITPILQEVQASYQGKVEVVTVDADSHPELGVCYEINSIPTLLCFLDGQMRGRHVGLASKQAIISELEQLLGSVWPVAVSADEPAAAVHPLLQTKQPKSQQA